ncbi:Uncharacterised protein [Mycobacteroides abscessus subsp. abscessus]|nr:Uncharacterised protein [Mycobacteroides abscessus subsp. abscessus]
MRGSSISMTLTSSPSNREPKSAVESTATGPASDTMNLMRSSG